MGEPEKIRKRKCVCGGTMVLCPGKYRILVNGDVFDVTPNVWKCPQCHNRKIATSEITVYEDNNCEKVVKIGNQSFPATRMKSHVCEDCGAEMKVENTEIRTAFLSEKNNENATPEDFSDPDLFQYAITVPMAVCPSCGVVKVVTGKTVVYEDNDPANSLKEARNSAAAQKASGIVDGIPNAETRANPEMNEVSENIDPGEDPETAGKEERENGSCEEAEENACADPGEPDFDPGDTGYVGGEIPEPDCQPDAPDDPETDEESGEKDRRGSGNDEGNEEGGDRTDDANTASTHEEDFGDDDVPPDQPIPNRGNGGHEKDVYREEPVSETEKPRRNVFDLLKSIREKRKEKKAKKNEIEAFVGFPVIEEVKGDVLYSTKRSDFICDEIKETGYGASSVLLKRYYYKTKKGRFFSADVTSKGKVEITILDEPQMKMILSKKPELYQKFISDYEV